MKKVILLCCVAILAAASSIKANEKYLQKMGETIPQFNSCSSIEDYQNLANKFRVIAGVESGEWLPLYYEAQCYILMSFMDGTDAARDGYLDQANTILEKMMEMAPEEAEAHVLLAFYHTGRMVINPADRAMSTAPLIGASLGRALSIEPDNPRALFMKLSNEIGTANYFGSDTTPLCKQAGELLKNWDAYTVKSAIYPAWGKDQVEQIVAGCEM